MFGLNLLSKAVATLTGNLSSLAATVAEINSGLRGRLQLDHTEEPDQLPHRIEAEPARGNRSRKSAAAE